MEEEELDESDLSSNLDGNYTYIFVVDRSGSMSGRRMEITKEAMKLFMQSLPPRSSYAIISFGSSFSISGVHEYSTINLQDAIYQISDMRADMGGTEIYEPVAAALTKLQTTSKKRIFLLTDGSVS